MSQEHYSNTHAGQGDKSKAKLWKGECAFFSRFSEAQAPLEPSIGFGAKRTFGLNSCVPTNIFKDLTRLHGVFTAVHRL
jgi:hypothetical protein